MPVAEFDDNQAWRTMGCLDLLRAASRNGVYGTLKALMYMHIHHPDDINAESAFALPPRGGLHIHAHRLGQVFGHLAMGSPVEERTRTFNLLRSIPDWLEALEYQPHNHGFIHGSVWYYVGVAPDLKWDGIVGHLCDPSWPIFLSCVHGVGHGSFIRHSQQPFSPCSRIGDVWPDAEGMNKARQFCADAPTLRVGEVCANGLYHSYYENKGASLVGKEDGDWAFPCQTSSPFEQHCFFWNALIGWRGVTDWRLKTVSTVTGHVSRACFDLPMDSETVRLGCITGVSTVYFPHYDWAVAGPADSAVTPNEETCSKFPGPLIALGLPAGPCKMLFDPQRSPPQHTSPITLVAWCSHFIDPAAGSSAANAERWMACVGGLDWTALQGLLAFALPHTFDGFCDQLRHAPTVLNVSTRERASSWCKRTFGGPMG